MIAAVQNALENLFIFLFSSTESSLVDFFVSEEKNYTSPRIKGPGVHTGDEYFAGDAVF